MMNALVNPMDIQQGVMGAFQAGRSMRAQSETQNALASLVGNPGDQQAMTRLAQFNPQAAMQMQERQAQQQDLALRKQAEQQKQQQADMGQIRKLLRFAKTNPQQALAAAQQMGLDVSQVPPANDPAFQGWVDQQIFIADALDSETGVEALSTAGKIAADMGFKPGTPEHAARTREIFLADAAKPYTGAEGETRLYIPQLGGAGAMPAPMPGTVVGGYSFRGGNPNDRNSWEPVGAGGPTQPASGGFRP